MQCRCTSVLLSRRRSLMPSLCAPLNWKKKDIFSEINLLLIPPSEYRRIWNLQLFINIRSFLRSFIIFSFNIYLYLKQQWIFTLQISFWPAAVKSHGQIIMIFGQILLRSMRHNTESFCIHSAFPPSSHLNTVLVLHDRV